MTRAEDLVRGAALPGVHGVGREVVDDEQSDAEQLAELVVEVLSSLA